MDEKTQTQIEPHTEAVTPSPPDSTRVSKTDELRRKSAEYLETVAGGKKLDPEDKDRITHMVAEDIYQAGFEAIRRHLKGAA